MLINLERILLEYYIIETKIFKKLVIHFKHFSRVAKSCTNIAEVLQPWIATNVGFYKSNGKMEIMGVQQYFLRIAYVFINHEGIFTKMLKMAKQY